MKTSRKGGDKNQQLPEPSTILLLGMGLIGTVGLGRKNYSKLKH